jgi:hypothetical protein
MLGLLAKAGIASVVGYVVIRVLQQTEVDKKLAEWGTGLADKLVTSVVQFNEGFSEAAKAQEAGPTPEHPWRGQ